MSYRRERASKASLSDGLEEGGLRASSSYSDINEQDNEKAVQSLQDRVVFLKRLTGDIHEEVESHNRLLDRMGNDMDASRGIMSGTMARFKMVFEKKSSRRMCTCGLFCGFLPNHILSLQGSQIVYAGLKQLAAPGLKFVITSQNDWPY